MRKGFTLIELIFVIVIIGLLAAVAVPKFVNLKQNAEASNVVKQTIDAAQQAVESAVNFQDLENNSSFTLQDIVKLNGKGWQYDTPTGTNGRYEYNDTAANNGAGAIVTEINLSVASREVNYSIDCTKFNDTTTQAKCKALIGNQDSISVNLTY